MPLLYNQLKTLFVPSMHFTSMGMIAMPCHHGGVITIMSYPSYMPSIFSVTFFCWKILHHMPIFLFSCLSLEHPFASWLLVMQRSNATTSIKNIIWEITAINSTIYFGISLSTISFNTYSMSLKTSFQAFTIVPHQ